MSITYDLKDLARLRSALVRAGGVPQRVVTPAARQGASLVLDEAQERAPVRTGTLKRGLALVGERSRYKGRKVYEVTPSPKYKDLFKRTVLSPGARGSKSTTKRGEAYYPASQEYGFLTRGRDGRIRHVPGKHFLAQANQARGNKAREVMIHKVISALEKELEKK